MIYERFRAALLQMRDDAIISLPICNRDNEIIFFYYMCKDDDKWFVENILNVFSRDRKTGAINELIEEKNLLCGVLKKNAIAPIITGTEALMVKNDYLRLYEEFYQMADQLYSVPKTDFDYSKLFLLFDRLTPPSSLYEIYMELGKDYFTLLKSNLYEET